MTCFYPFLNDYVHFSCQEMFNFAPMKRYFWETEVFTRRIMLLALLLATLFTAEARKPKSLGDNPIAQGWYADPEAAFLNNRYWIFPTFSAPYDEQLHFDG